MSFLKVSVYLYVLCDAVLSLKLNFSLIQCALLSLRNLSGQFSLWLSSAGRNRPRVHVYYVFEKSM